MTILLKPLQGGRPIILDKPIILIGRHSDCDVILKNSAKISRKHCCVALVNNRFVVRDLDSMNGVWVNGDRVDHTSGLRIGDELMIGDLPFTLARSSEEKSKRHNETVVIPDEDDLPAPKMKKKKKKGRQAPADASASDGVEFGSAFDIPAMEGDSEDDDYVIPIADFDEEL